MVTIPGFLLRRLYVKGSLENCPQGFQFQLKNMLGSGYARKLKPLTVDDLELPLTSSFFSVDGEQFCFDDVCEEKPFTLSMNKTTDITVTGVTLESGPRKIGMGFEVKGLGELSFNFVDVVGNG